MIIKIREKDSFFWKEIINHDINHSESKYLI